MRLGLVVVFEVIFEFVFVIVVVSLLKFVVFLSEFVEVLSGSECAEEFTGEGFGAVGVAVGVFGFGCEVA